jgi:hypothetical protein
MKKLNRFPGFLAIANSTALLCIMLWAADQRAPLSVGAEKLVGVKAGATKQGKKESVQRQPMGCNMDCYPAGGHGFKCFDDSPDDTIVLLPFETNIDYTRTAFDCTPLMRYTFEDCTPDPPTNVGDCNDDYHVASDP